MPAPWVAGAELRIVGSLHGQETVNVWHFATNSQINDPTELDLLLSQLVNAMRDCIIEFLLPAVTSDWRFVQVDARRIAPVTSDPFVLLGTAQDVGELSPCSHSISSTLVQLRTGTGGRSGRGRKFMPPPGETEITASNIDAPTLALMAAFLACVASKFISASASTTWRLGVLSQKNLSAAGGTFDNSFREVLTMAPSTGLAYMGSRRVGRGS